MAQTLQRMTPGELRETTSGELVIRLLECARRLEAMPHAGWLRLRYDDVGNELVARQRLGWLSPALCGVWSHLLTPEGAIRHCACHQP